MTSRAPRVRTAVELDILYQALKTIQHIQRPQQRRETSVPRRHFSKISAERPIFQAREIEAMHVFDERDKSARAKVECGFALVERAGGCVSYRAARVKVLRHPAEAGGMARAQLRELAFHRDRQRLRAWHLGAHRLGLEREHERGLDLAGMDAMRKLRVREQPLGIAEPVPRGGGHEHAEANAQIASDDIDDRRIAPV